MHRLVNLILKLYLKDVVVSSDVLKRDGHSDLLSCAKECTFPCLSLFYNLERGKCFLAYTVYESGAVSLRAGRGWRYYRWSDDHFLIQECPYSESTHFIQMHPNSLEEVTRNTSILLFLVKICKNANVVLQSSSRPTHLSRDLTHVVIGGWRNTISSIRNCLTQCPFQESYKESGIVSCDEFRPFWLSWKNGRVEVGKGLVVSERVFMEWTPVRTLPVVNYVSLSSHRRSEGKWLFIKQ